jgi:hypothetical protein
LEVAGGVGLNGSITANLASTEGLGAATGQTRTTRGDASRDGSHWDDVAVDILEVFGDADTTAGLGGRVEGGGSTAREGSGGAGAAHCASVSVGCGGAAKLGGCSEGRVTTAGFALGDTTRDDGKGHNSRDDSFIVDLQIGG